jgi:hypothetical protein
MKDENNNKQDFHEFCDWALQRVIDALIRGGFSAVKSEMTFIIGQATINAQRGWKAVK